MLIRRIMTVAIILTLGMVPAAVAQGGGNGGGSGDGTCDGTGGGNGGGSGGGNGGDNGGGNGQGSGPGTNGSGMNGCQGALIERFDLLVPEELSGEEETAIIFLKEEEKLARDVYLTLSLDYGSAIFTNIARSEDHHMGLVDLLITRYGLTDPTEGNPIGVFTNPEIGALYTSLVAQGQQSLVDALVVGAIIEDMDLADLYHMIEMTDNLDIALIAQNLAAGSRNHLRAFMKVLGLNGGTYDAQYLDADVMAEILASDPERGVVYDEFGDVLAECGGPRGRRVGAQGGSSLG